jgi:hypothetical protein
MEVSEIRIRADGKWYRDGEVEMFRRDILNILARHIGRDEAGGYYIQMGEENFPIVVEDVPFFATGVSEKEEGLTLSFHDLQEMELNQPQRLYLRGDIPYLSFHWEADTRLSRGIYYKLSDYFVFQGDEVYLVPPGCEMKS